MRRMAPGRTRFATAAACFNLAVLALLAGCSRARMVCGGGVRSTNPDSTSSSCSSTTTTGMAATVYESLSAQRVPIAPGLSYDFYDKSCPQYKSIIETAIAQALRTNPLHAAGLSRIHFHDCFVQGCDASVLLTDTESAPSEQKAIPNKTLRQESLQLLNELKSTLEQTCPHTVSCADLISLGAAEAVRQANGPAIDVPVGRRDSLSMASNQSVTNGLPSPRQNISELMSIFSELGLDYTDLVALSGAHTLGNAKCVSFEGRLRPTVDPNLDADFASTLSNLCPNGSQNSMSLDSTPNSFDNKFFKQILSGEALLTSDAALELDVNTQYLVKQFSRSNSRFGDQFARSFLKMSQISVLTGSAGEIRKTCSIANSPASEYN